MLGHTKILLKDPKAIVDIATAAAPPKSISLPSAIKSINEIPSKTLEIVTVCITKEQ